MTISADNLRNARAAFASALQALEATARAMAEAEAPNGGAACAMYMQHARQHALAMVAALDNRIRTVTLPALPRLPAPLAYETR